MKGNGFLKVTAARGVCFHDAIKLFVPLCQRLHECRHVSPVWNERKTDVGRGVLKGGFHLSGRYGRSTPFICILNFLYYFVCETFFFLALLM